LDLVQSIISKRCLKKLVGEERDQKLFPEHGKVLLPVDLIRTVAIILVILLHASIEPAPAVDIMSSEGVQLWWASNVYASLASPAVPLFIMLTGALLLQPSKVNEPLKVFFKKRLSRIGLPFLFWGGAYFAWRVFVNGEVLTSGSILQGVLAGPYFHFWFLYLLLGLYLFTPLLRVIVAYADWKLIKYFLLVWFVGTALVPLFGLYENLIGPALWFKQNVFLLSGMMGYFVLGAYMVKWRLRSSILILILASSLVFTISGTYFLVGTLGERFSQFFYDASSVSIVIASIALFLLLLTVPAKQVENQSRINRFLHLVSQNTLPIYLFHVMVLEVLQKGYLGFKISVTTMNPIVEIPFITVIALLVSLVVIIPLKKIPYVKRIVG